jgi:hypothetical protein
MQRVYLEPFLLSEALIRGGEPIRKPHGRYELGCPLHLQGNAATTNFARGNEKGSPQPTA